MLEYRTCETATTDAEPTIPAPTRVQGVPSYMLLPAKYGISDMKFRIGTGNLGKNGQTVDQEYHNYVTPPFTVQDPDPLRFWDVGGGIYCA